MKLSYVWPGPDKDLIEAHKHSAHNRNEIEKSEACGCFYCGSIFAPSEITEWVDGDQTAICPKCPVDSVLASSSGYPVTPEFLKRMHDKYF